MSKQNYCVNALIVLFIENFELGGKHERSGDERVQGRFNFRVCLDNFVLCSLVAFIFRCKC